MRNENRDCEPNYPLSILGSGGGCLKSPPSVSGFFSAFSSPFPCFLSLTTAIAEFPGIKPFIEIFFLDRKIQIRYIPWNAALAIDSIRRLVRLAKRENATLLPGHEPDCWSKIKRSPDCYR